jgi:hypothetical protein
VFLEHRQNDGRLTFSHCMLVRDKTAALLVTGCGLEQLGRIKQKHSPALLTDSHAHPDHSAADWLFHGASLFVPREGFDSRE